MNNRVFVIGDTHFGHKKILELEKESRPFKTIEEHDNELVYRWNSVVNKNDTVWHLGDVLFGKESFQTLYKLNGFKHLVMGNHDCYPMEDYKKHFNKIVGCIKLRECIFSHIPISDSQFYRFKANIHGHMHSNKLDDSRYINVSAEQINLTPKLLDTVIHDYVSTQRKDA
jgi:calcineurin-like phosphoesterase family protein